MLRHGAAIQDRQIGRGERYPALGLHWLLGLVRLAQDDVEDALAEFERERALAEPHRLYGREYAMHAAIGRGAALLRAGRRDDAAASFRDALALYPDHPLAHLGLAVAGECGIRAGRNARSTVMDRAKPIDAALVRGAVARGPGQRGRPPPVLWPAAIEDAPPGFAGWSLPVEPLSCK